MTSTEMNDTPLFFWPHTFDPCVASYRIRCKNVMDGLSDAGITSKYYPGKLRQRLKLTPHIEAPRTLVISKMTRPKYLQWAVSLKKRYGTRLILDICDNIFFESSPGAAMKERTRQTIEALDHFDVIVTPSRFLGDQIAMHLRPDMRFAFIPDAIEPEPDVTLPVRWRERQAFKELQQLEDFIDRSAIAPGRKLVWFGSHGAKAAQNGMNDVRKLLPILEKHHGEEKISLTIVSNHREKYEKFFGQSPIETFYLEWNAYTVSRCIQKHDITIIPISPNDYNLSKSANRLTTAFSNGTAVCASAIGSYEPFRESAVFDDWEDGLAALMQSQPERHRRIEAGNATIRQNYTQQAISDEWKRLLATLSDS